MMITLEKNVELNAAVDFKSATSGRRPSLILTKQEKEGMVYDLAVKLLKITNGRPCWLVQLNGEYLGHKDGGQTVFGGSVALGFSPVSEGIIKVSEEDEKGVNNYWVDLSDPKRVLSKTSLATSAKIQALIEKAKVFQPGYGMKVRKIFHNEEAGVILYARDDRWEGAIYVARPDDTAFEKAEAKMKWQCKCLQGDSGWRVTLPFDGTQHDLEFALGAEMAGGHAASTAWDGKNLRQVVL